jgi:hypothetical protein
LVRTSTRQYVRLSTKQETCFLGYESLRICQPAISRRYSEVPAPPIPLLLQGDEFRMKRTYDRQPFSAEVQLRVDADGNLAAAWRVGREMRCIPKLHAHKSSNCNTSPELRFSATLGEWPEVEVALV